MKRLSLLIVSELPDAMRPTLSNLTAPTLTKAPPPPLYRLFRLADSRRAAERWFTA
jgi:hypothetical protein